MTKQNKVLNRIDFDCGREVTDMKAAKQRKNDEFYTELKDISKELENYGSKLTGKRIICPCDCDIFKDEEVYSITVEFSKEAEFAVFSRTYSINKVARVEYDTWGDKIEPKVVTDEEAQELIRKRVTCNFLRHLCELGSQFGAVSVTASGYDTFTNRGVRFQDVDYSQYDICVTNPPFSLYGEFMKRMIAELDKRKDTDNPFNFILLAPFLNRVTPNVGLNLMLKKCFLGYGRKLPVTFVAPTLDNGLNRKAVACDWITTYPDAQNDVDATRLHTSVSYELYKDEFYEMENMTMKDGTHPIKIANMQVVPDDYYGWMFCSIGILDNLSNEEFEWYGTAYKGYFNSHPDESPFAHKVGDAMVEHNGERDFHGIVFRRRKP